MRSARRAAGLSVAQVAVAIGRNPDTIYRWEQGRSSPSLDDIQALAKLTERPVSYFVDAPREVAA